MKKLIYLVIVVIMFAVPACGGGETENQNMIAACGDDCQKACCLGCKATQGPIKCVVLADGSMPCCVPGEM